MLSTIILTKNNQSSIAKCLSSVFFSHKIIIVDDLSSDKTLAITQKFCQNQNIKLEILSKKLENFADQRNFALNKIKSGWVLFLDSDEYLTKNLIKEIAKITKNPPKNLIYSLPRQDLFLNKTLKFGETGNTKIIRLLFPNSGKWKGRIHETFIPNKNIRVKHLLNPILHNHNISISEFFTRINFYSSLRAKELKEQGIKEGFLKLFFYPKIKFFYNYFLKLGFLDAFPGFCLAILMSFHSFLVRVKLQLLWREK